MPKALSSGNKFGAIRPGLCPARHSVHWSLTVVHICILPLLQRGHFGFRISASERQVEQKVCPQWVVKPMDTVTRQIGQSLLLPLIDGIKKN